MAAIVLDRMHLNALSFVIAVAIFTVVYAVLKPFIAVQLRKLGSAALGGVALVATLAALVVTDLTTDGLSISGLWTWLAATGIVWVASLIAAFVLPLLGLKKYLAAQS